MKHDHRLTVTFLFAALLVLSACTGGVTADADGNFVGTVTQVREDSLRMDVDSGGSMGVDTFAVCGDATAANISVGDRLTITAERELFGFDAISILDENGEPACGGSSSADGDGGGEAGTDTGGETTTTAADAAGGGDGAIVLQQPAIGACETIDAPEGGTFVIEGVGSAVVTIEGDQIEVGEITDEEGWSSNVNRDPDGDVEVEWRMRPDEVWIDMELSGGTLRSQLCADD